MSAITLIEPSAKIISKPTLRFRAARLRPKGMTARLISTGAITINGASAKQRRVRAGRHNQLLGHQLETVGYGLQQPGRANLSGSRATLKPPGAFALDPDQVSRIEGHKAHDDHH